MALLHSLKKTAFRLQVPVSPALARDSESDLLRHQLRHIRSQLQHLLRVSHAAAAMWLQLLHNQRNFSERFQEAYPNNDALARVCALLRADSQRLASQFAREALEQSPLLRHLREQLRAYVQRIAAVEALYPRVDAAHAELHRYKRKVDALLTRTAAAAAPPPAAAPRWAPRRAADPARKQRNLDKLQAAEAAHSRLLADVLCRQRKLFAVHATLFHAALVAFWLSHSSCVDALVGSLRHARRFAEAEHHAMHRLDVQQLVDDADGQTAVSPHVGVRHLAFDSLHPSPTASAATAAPAPAATATATAANATAAAAAAAASSRSTSRSPSRSSSSSSSSPPQESRQRATPAVDVHEVHHFMSTPSGDKRAARADAPPSTLSPTGVQLVQH